MNPSIVRQLSSRRSSTAHFLGHGSSPPRTGRWPDAKALVHDCRRFFADEKGTTGVASIVLITSILSLGALVGLATVRDHLVQQFGDLSVSLDHLDQSYFYEAFIDGNHDGDYSDPEDCVFSGQYFDGTALVDAVGAAPACLNLSLEPEPEQ